MQLRPELDVVAPERQRRAVDRGQRRTQLVRDGRDEILAHRLERPLLGEVTERVDGAVLVADRRDREPQLALIEIDRNASPLEPPRRPARSGAPLDRAPARNRVGHEAADHVLSRAIPVIRSAAGFHSRTRPLRRRAARRRRSSRARARPARAPRPPGTAARSRSRSPPAARAPRRRSARRARTVRPDSVEMNVIAPSTRSRALQRHAHVRAEPELRAEAPGAARRARRCRAAPSVISGTSSDSPLRITAATPSASPASGG